MKYDVAIVGAGVIGSMVARELSRYRLSVVVLEKENDVARGASGANSGIIHGGYDPEPDTLKAEMNIKGIDLLYKAARELNVHHKNNGSLVCAFGTPEEDAAVKMLYERGITNGIDCVKIISGDEARALEPQLSETVSSALYVPNAGIICPYDLTLAAIGNAMDNGVTLKTNFAVAEIENKDGFTLTAEGGERVESRYLVNCAGCYSDKIAALAGDGFFEIIPRAGEYMLLDKKEGSRASFTIFQVPSIEGKGILVTPTVDGNLLVGPTAMKVESPAHTETTADGLAVVQKFAAKSVPSVNFRQVITSFSGVRSSVKGGDFIIRASEKIENLVHVAAIDSPGLTSCVAIAQKTVGILKELGVSLAENPDWNPTRENTRAFREMNDAEKNAFIKKNPAYGKIVCRCEGISEGEMVASLHRNPPATDLDGIKRRTRGGMGRCQGGFCSPTVMQIIAREKGISLQEVTKSGKGSEPIVGKL